MSDLIDLHEDGAPIPTPIAPAAAAAHRSAAERVMQTWSTWAGRKLAFDDSSVEWVDGYLARLREGRSLADADQRGMVLGFGSFLGECLVQNLGGKWMQLGPGRVVVLPDGWASDPFTKVSLHLNAPFESIYSYYTALPVLMQTARTMPPAKGRPRFIAANGQGGHVRRSLK
jgi:hypothetical protein